jgi:hypothetical protein
VANAREIADRIAAWNRLSSIDRGDLVRQLRSCTQLVPDDASLLLSEYLAMVRSEVGAGATPLAVSELTASIVEAILAARTPPREPDGRLLRREDIQAIDATYRLLGGAGPAQAQLLRLLTSDAGREALQTAADLIVDCPPADVRDAILGISPLLQQGTFDVSAVFPRLLAALAHPHLAALVLDLANFVTRRNLAPVHPAAGRVRELAELLGQVVGRLGQIEENPVRLGMNQQQLRAAVDDSLAVCIAVCDALALVGDKSVTGKLRQALSLGHRRVRTEAAAALARLGDPQGFDCLVELAADPASRTRALAYLDELRALERARPEDRTPAARAAAQLADWLAEPGQFGAPPHTVKLIDARRQFWPGYDEPIECRLFAYEYRLRDGTLRGIGIVGPVTYSLAADLEDLPPDDIYAAFAGWQTEHADLQETAAEVLPQWKRKSIESRLAPWSAEGYQDLELVKVGHFFGDEILVASARRGGVGGTLVIDAEQVTWYPAGSARRPIGPNEAYYIHKGRKLLKTFNPQGHRPLDELSDSIESL